MKGRLVVWGGAAAIALGLGGFGGWILRLPATSAAAGAPPIDRDEEKAVLDGLKPPKRQRPVIAVIGINDATETTDYLMPAGILRRADVASGSARNWESSCRPGSTRCHWPWSVTHGHARIDHAL